MRSSPCDPERLLPVTIHRLTDERLPLLAGALGEEQAAYYRERFPLQREGRGLTLLALAAERSPVGGVFVQLDPPEEREVRAAMPGVPMLYRARVAAGHRRRCVGTQLLAATHELLRRRGHDRVALGVDTVNGGALRLYQRLGYQFWNGWSYGDGPLSYDIMVLDLLTADRTRGRSLLCACALDDTCPLRAAPACPG